MVKKKTRKEARERRNYIKLAVRKLRKFKKKTKTIKNIVLPKPTNIWATKDVCWVTRAPISERSNPDIILTMDKYKWFPQQVKMLRLYDPFYNTGAVKKSYVEVGWDVGKIDHRYENCFESFERRITQRTVFVTNPPFLEDVLLSFFALLAHMDLPCVLILRRGISETDYFGDFWELMSDQRRLGDLYVRSFNRSFRMCNTEKSMETGREIVKGFAGLTIATYYPKDWEWSPPDQLFERAIPKYDLHLPIRNEGKKVRKRMPTFYKP